MAETRQDNCWSVFFWSLIVCAILGVITYLIG